MDKFKQHIQQNRQELDAKEPSNAVWMNIQQQLPKPKPALVISITAIKWAAAACIIALCGWGIMHLLGNKPATGIAGSKPILPAQTAAPKNITVPQEENGQLATTTPVEENPLTPKHDAPKPSGKEKQTAQNNDDETTMLSLESSFINIINLQKAKISSTPLYTEGPGYYSDFVVRFKQIDKDEQAIKNAIAKQGLTDELLNRLINMYQQKLNVLKAMQVEINKTNSRYMQNRNPTDTANHTTFIHI